MFRYFAIFFFLTSMTIFCGQHPHIIPVCLIYVLIYELFVGSFNTIEIKVDTNLGDIVFFLL